MKKDKFKPSYQEGLSSFWGQRWLYAFFVTFVFGCTSEKESSSGNDRLLNFNVREGHIERIKGGSSVTINSKEIIPEIGVASELFQNRRYIKLSTPENIIIGEISKVDFLNNLIFVLDNRISNNVFVFNKLGEFLFIVGKKGAGPNEHLDPIDFFVKDNSIFLIDQRYTLFKYSLENEFIEKIDLPLSTNSFFAFNNGSIIFTTNQSNPEDIAYGLVQLNEEDIQPRFKKNQFNALNRYTSSPVGFNRALHKNSFLYFRPLDTEVYQVYEDELVLRYKIVDQDTLSSEILKDETRLVNERYDYTWIYNWPILETSRFTQIRLMHRGIVTILLDKESKDIKSFSGIKDDLLFGAIQDFPVHANKDKFYLPLNVEQLYFAKTELKKVGDKDVLNDLKENRPEFLSLIEDIDDLSNPILLECEIF